MLFEYIISFLLLHAIDYGYLVLNKTKISKYITTIQLEPIQFKYKYMFISYILALFTKQNKYLIYSDLLLRTISIIIVIYTTKKISLFFKHVI